MSPIISNGFADCPELCDPVKGYPYSCERLCPDYTFSTSSPETTTTSSHVSAPTIIVGTLIGIILLIALFIVICYRQRICSLLHRRDEQHGFSIQETVSSTDSEHTADSKSDGSDKELLQDPSNDGAESVDICSDTAREPNITVVTTIYRDA